MDYPSRPRGRAPVCEQIIKGTAARTPDSISRNRRPAIGNPPAIPVLPPMRRSHSLCHWRR
jgi:hypothetical protein